VFVDVIQGSPVKADGQIPMWKGGAGRQMPVSLLWFLYINCLPPWFTFTCVKVISSKTKFQKILLTRGLWHSFCQRGEKK